MLVACFAEVTRNCSCGWIGCLAGNLPFPLGFADFFPLFVGNDLCPYLRCDVAWPHVTLTSRPPVHTVLTVGRQWAVPTGGNVAINYLWLLDHWWCWSWVRRHRWSWVHCVGHVKLQRRNMQVATRGRFIAFLQRKGRFAVWATGFLAFHDPMYFDEVSPITVGKIAIAKVGQCCDKVLFVPLTSRMKVVSHKDAELTLGFKLRLLVAVLLHG